MTINKISRSGTSVVTLAELQSGSAIFVQKVGRVATTGPVITGGLISQADIIKRGVQVQTIISRALANPYGSVFNFFDRLGLSDEAILLLARQVALADQFFITHNTPKFLLNKGLSDSEPILERISLRIAAFRVFEDAQFVSTATKFTLTRPLADSQSLLDFARIAAGYQRAAADIQTIVDTRLSKVIGKNNQDAVTQSDLNAKRITALKQDQAISTEAKALAVGKGLFDSVTVRNHDDPGPALFVTKLLRDTTTILDLTGVFDGLTYQNIMYRFETITMTDSFSRTIAANRKFNESQSIVEKIYLGRGFAYQDAATPADNKQLAIGLGLGRADITTITENLRSVFGFGRVFQDAEIIAEVKALTAGLGKNDVAAMLERLYKASTKANTDTTTATENIGKSPIKKLIDSILSAETIAKNPGKFKNSIVDPADQRPVFAVGKQLGDTTTMQDLAAAFDGITYNYGLGKLDAVSIIDASVISRVFLAVRKFQDTQTISDRVAIARGLAFAARSDTFTPSDRLIIGKIPFETILIGSQQDQRSRTEERISFAITRSFGLKYITQSNDVDYFTGVQENFIGIDSGQQFTGSVLFNSTSAGAYVQVTGVGTGAGLSGGFITQFNNPYVSFNGAGNRILTTTSLDFTTNTSAGVTFSYIAGNNSNGGEQPDINEDLVIEYSIDGGTSFVTAATIFAISTYGTTSWSTFSTSLPVAALTTGTILRWRQTAQSISAGDNWGITNIQLGNTSFGTYVRTYYDKNAAILFERISVGPSKRLSGDNVRVTPIGYNVPLQLYERWDQANSAQSTSTAASMTVGSMVYSSSSGRWVAVAADFSAVAWTSTDGYTWIPDSIPVINYNGAEWRIGADTSGQTFVCVVTPPVTGGLAVSYDGGINWLYLGTSDVETFDTGRNFSTGTFKVSARNASVRPLGGPVYSSGRNAWIFGYGKTSSGTSAYGYMYSSSSASSVPAAKWSRGGGFDNSVPFFQDGGDITCTGGVYGNGVMMFSLHLGNGRDRNSVTFLPTNDTGTTALYYLSDGSALGTNFTKALDVVTSGAVTYIDTSPYTTVRPYGKPSLSYGNGRFIWLSYNGWLVTTTSPTVTASWQWYRVSSSNTTSINYDNVKQTFIIAQPGTTTLTAGFYFSTSGTQSSWTFRSANILRADLRSDPGYTSSDVAVWPQGKKAIFTSGSTSIALAITTFTQNADQYRIGQLYIGSYVEAQIPYINDIETFPLFFNKFAQQGVSRTFSGTTVTAQSPDRLFIGRQDAVGVVVSSSFTITAVPDTLTSGNIITWSEDFTTSRWTLGAFGVIATADQTIAPDGTLTADKLTQTGGGGNYVQQNDVTTLLAGVTYNHSVWLKGDGSSVGQLCAIGNFANGARVGQTSLTLTADWQRLSASFVAAGTANRNIFIQTNGVAGSNMVAGQSVYAWGYQITTGSALYAYARTTSTTLDSGIIPAHDEYTTSYVFITGTSVRYSGEPLENVKFNAVKGVLLDPASMSDFFKAVVNTVIPPARAGSAEILPVTDDFAKTFTINRRFADALTSITDSIRLIIAPTRNFFEALLIGSGQDQRQRTEERISFAITKPFRAVYVPSQYVYGEGGNIIPWSEDFTSSPWISNGITVVADQDTAPDSTFTADKFVVDTGFSYVQQPDVALKQGETYTHSVYLRGDGSSIGQICAIGDYDNGNRVGQTSLTLTADWQRLSATFTTLSNTNRSCFIQPAGIAGSNLAVGQSVFVWGYQITTGSTLQAYVRTTSTAIQGPIISSSGGQYDDHYVAIADRPSLVYGLRTIRETQNIGLPGFTGIRVSGDNRERISLAVSIPAKQGVNLTFSGITITAATSGERLFIGQQYTGAYRAGDGLERIQLQANKNIYTDNRINLLPWSEDVSQGTTGFLGASRNNNIYTAPDGTSSGAQIYGLLSGSRVYTTVRVTPGVEYTWSFYAYGTADTSRTVAANLQVYNADNASEILIATTSYLSQIALSSWTRITVPLGIIPGTIGKLRLEFLVGVTAEMGIWGWQLNEGSSATNYVKTTASPLATPTDSVRIGNPSTLRFGRDIYGTGYSQGESVQFAITNIKRETQSIADDGIVKILIINRIIRDTVTVADRLFKDFLRAPVNETIVVGSGEDRRQALTERTFFTIGKRFGEDVVPDDFLVTFDGLTYNGFKLIRDTVPVGLGIGPRVSGSDIERTVFDIVMPMTRGVAGTVAVKTINAAGNGTQSSVLLGFGARSPDIVGTVDLFRILLIVPRDFTDFFTIGSDNGFRSTNSLETTKFTITKIATVGSDPQLIGFGSSLSTGIKVSGSDLERIPFNVTKLAKQANYTPYTSGAAILYRGSPVIVRGNLVKYSEDLSQQAANFWVINQVSVTSNAIAGPFSTARNAQKVSEAGTTFTHPYIYPTIGPTTPAVIVSGTTITASVYFKAGERYSAEIAHSNYVNSLAFASFNLSSGTIIATGFWEQYPDVGDWTSLAATISAAGNGWYRCSLTVTKTNVGAGTTYQVAPLFLTHNGTTSTYTGTVGNGIYVWGAQVEYANSVGPYIPTTSTQIVLASNTASNTDFVLVGDPRPTPRNSGNQFENLSISFNKSLEAGSNSGIITSTDRTFFTIGKRLNDATVPDDFLQTFDGLTYNGYKTLRDTATIGLGLGFRVSGSDIERTIFDISMLMTRGVAGSVTVKTIDAPGNNAQSSVAINFGARSPDIVGTIDRISIIQIKPIAVADFFTIGTDAGFRNSNSSETTKFTITKIATVGSDPQLIGFGSSLSTGIKVSGSDLERTPFNITKRAKQDNYTPYYTSLTTRYFGAPNIDRGNFLANSENFLSSWSLAQANVSANVIISPIGTNNGFRLLENLATKNTHYVRQATGSTYGSGSVVTFSIWAKAAERAGLELAISNGVNSIVNATFNLSSGTVIATGHWEEFPYNGDWTSTTATMQAAGNGWYRCSITTMKTNIATGSTGFASIQPHVLIHNLTTSNYAGVVGNGIYIWGAQLENAGNIGPYIPTLAASARLLQNFANDSDFVLAGFGSAGAGLPRVAGNQFEKLSIDFFKDRTGILDRAFFTSETVKFTTTKLLQENPAILDLISISTSRPIRDLVVPTDFLERTILRGRVFADMSGDLDPFGNINTMVSLGTLRMTSYVDIDYLEADYVGESRSFT